jgi:hypothetical protein
VGGIIIFLVFILLLIATAVIIIAKLVTKKPGAGISLFLICSILILFGFAMYLGKIIKAKKVLEKEDYFGEYTIDRDYFTGKQTDWQYNHYRFKIKENDSIYFYVTDREKINETYKGVISTLASYRSARLVIEMESPIHHVLTTNPTIYREAWGFFMVFKSPKFNNMYFRKAEWKPIE